MLATIVRDICGTDGCDFGETVLGVCLILGGTLGVLAFLWLLLHDD